MAQIIKTNSRIAIRFIFLFLHFEPVVFPFLSHSDYWLYRYVHPIEIDETTQHVILSDTHSQNDEPQLIRHADLNLSYLTYP